MLGLVWGVGLWVWGPRLREQGMASLWEIIGLRREARGIQENCLMMGVEVLGSMVLGFAWFRMQG